MWDNIQLLDMVLLISCLEGYWIIWKLSIFYTLTHITHTSPLNSSGSKDWLVSSDLRLIGDLAVEWNNYILTLRKAGIQLKDEGDCLVWSWNRTDGSVTVKNSYEALVFQQCEVEYEWWHKLKSGKLMFLWRSLFLCGFILMTEFSVEWITGKEVVEDHLSALHAQRMKNLQPT